MATATIAGHTVDIDEQGFLTNPDQWSPEIAEALARESDIQLTDAHWKVIEFCRVDYRERHQSPTVRRITKGLGVSTKDVYALFPKGPGKLAAKLAGIPKPKGCI